MLNFEGVVKLVKYQCDKTQWTCVLVSNVKNIADKNKKTKFNNITVTGNATKLQPNDYIQFSGVIIDDPKYGKQIKTKSITKVIDKKNKIQGEPNTKSKNKPPLPKEEIDNFLDKIKIVKPSHREQLVEKYGNSLEKTIISNPYLLTELDGIGFKKADTIATTTLSVELFSETRLKASILETLNLASFRGHTALNFYDLVIQCLDLLEFNSDQREKIITCVDSMLQCKQIYKHKDMILLKKFHFQEQKIISFIKKSRMVVSKHIHIENNFIDLYEQKNNIVFSENQKDAIKKTVNSQISVITGGPGTGKTTITKLLLEIFKNNGLSVVLCAPTGKAAQRMVELTNCDSSTIHILLGYDGTGFKKNVENKIECSVLIIDESSMLDLSLTSHLLDATYPSTKIIFIGDVDQLPPVMPGLFLRNLIDSSVVPVSRLETIYRTSENSDINIVASKIKSGCIPQLHTINQSEIKDLVITDKIILINEKENIKQSLKEVVLDLLITKRQVELQDILIMSPRNEGDFGVNPLNLFSQRFLNVVPEDDPFVMINGVHFFKNDRIIETKNNYKIGSLNGDVGTIRGLTKENDQQIIEVKTDSGRWINYTKEHYKTLDLAYCITVHKSQGSEKDYVVLVLDKSAGLLLNRTLLYTALTRAKKQVFIVSTPDVIKKTIENTRETERFTTLKEKIIYYFN